MSDDIRDDPEYWDALAARVAAAATRDASPNAVQWLAESRACWMATAALLLVAIALARGFADDLPLVGLRDDWQTLVAPADSVGRAIALPDQPPSIAALVIGEPSRVAR